MIVLYFENKYAILHLIFNIIAVKIVHTINELQDLVQKLKNEGKTIGLVPTMGALHSGHLSLIQYLRPSVDMIFCSVFVNPTQFNDPEDLKKYPRPIESDIQLLQNNNCDVLFFPSEQEMYPQGEPEWHLDLGELEKAWEGEHRPGHFQGVTQIVYKLFDFVKPDIACFGQKDIQQIKVIQKLITLKNLPVKLAIAPTLRDVSGLALSSRNQRLSDKGLTEASNIYKGLQYIKDNLYTKEVSRLLSEAQNIIEKNENIKTEYIAICNETDLSPVNKINNSQKHIALVAVWLEGVRLIDNLPLD